MTKNIIIGLLLAGLLAGGSFFYQRLNTLEQSLQTQQSTPAPQQRAGNQQGRKDVDPYISGAVKNTILKHYSDIGDLYAIYLKSDTEPKSGKIKIDWQINGDGKVISPEVILSEFDAEQSLASDMIKEIARWQFPPPPSGTNTYVAHTFKLQETAPSQDELQAQQQQAADQAAQQAIEEHGS